MKAASNQGRWIVIGQALLLLDIALEIEVVLIVTLESFLADLETVRSFTKSQPLRYPYINVMFS
jgi:hypothetical protein